MNLTPYSPSEAILEPYWDMDKAADGSRRAVLDSYEIRFDANASGRLRPESTCLFDLPAGAAGVEAMALTRPCDVDLSGYDRLRLFARFSASLRLRLSAVIDGDTHVVLDNAPGEDGLQEYEGSVPRGRLQRLTFAFTRVSGDAALVELIWLMAADTQAERVQQTHRPHFNHAWQGFLRETPGEASPRLGLFFDEEELPAKRELWRSAPMDRWYHTVRDQAERSLEIDPEAMIDRLIAGANREKTRARERRQGWLGAGVEHAALVGLVEDRPDLSRHAARLSLSLCHCERWFDHVPGTTSHARAFYVSYVLRVLPLVLDWAGHVLTDHGKEVIRDAMILKGLPLAEADFRRWEYIRAMNQGLMFNVGRTLAYLALVRTYPRYEHDLALAEREEHEMLRQYIEPDGGTREGMGYWKVVADAFLVLAALARYRGRDVPELAPERIMKSGDFALAMRTTVGDCTAFLSINDARAPRLPIRAAAAFARYSNDPQWSALYRRMLETQPPAADAFHLLLANETPDASVAHESSSAPRFSVFANTGHVDALRDGERVPNIRLHLCSGSGRGGHSHQDKGSIILEAGGDLLLIDRGHTGYTATNYRDNVVAGAHNLVCPETVAGEPMEQCVTGEGGRVTDARQVGELWLMASDNRRAWPEGAVEKHVRRVVSPAAELIVLDDEVAFAEPRTASFFLHTLWPLAETGDGGWRLSANTADLLIQPLNWSPEQSEVISDGVDHEHRPVHMLRLRSGNARRHRIATLLEVVPASSESPWSLTRENDAFAWQRGEERLGIELTDTGVHATHEHAGDAVSRIESAA